MSKKRLKSSSLKTSKRIVEILRETTLVNKFRDTIGNDSNYLTMIVFSDIKLEV